MNFKNMHKALTTDSCTVYAQHYPDPSHRRILLSFTGIRQGMGGIGHQDTEFKSQSKKFDNVLYIVDTAVSWGNAVDFEHVRAALQDYIGDARVFAIGNSMGGFLSVIASSVWNIERVVSFVPQYSVHSAIVPQETRWKILTQKISDWRYPSLDGHFVDSTEYTILTTLDPLEYMHWRHFPQRENVHVFAFKNSEHNLAADLKRRSALSDVLDIALFVTPTLQQLSQHWSDGVYHRAFASAEHTQAVPLTA